MGTNQRSPASYYNVLGVGSDSSDDDIRRAYRKLAKVCAFFICPNYFWFHPKIDLLF